MFYRLMFLIGVALRNKEIFRCEKFLNASEKWNIEELERFQLVKLKEILEWAYSKCPFYYDLYKKNGFEPKDLSALSDTKMIPTVEKKDLIDNVDRIQIHTGLGRMFLSETSGSTGTPLVFYRDKMWDAMHRSAILRGYKWHGVKPWERNGYFWGYSFKRYAMMKIKLFDALQNRFRLFSYSEAEINNFLKKLGKASYLEGYSSMIYEICKNINSKKIQAKYNLKMIKGTSEKIFDEYQKETLKAMKRKIISEYGASECGIIAFECAEETMHITMESVFVEQDNNNEAIITNLFSKSFPIIRFKVGDYIKIDKDRKCRCGMAHYSVSEIFGRVGKVLHGHRNKYPSLTLYYIFKNIAIKHGITLNYQAIQNIKGNLEIRVSKNAGKKEADMIRREAEMYYKNDIAIVIDNKSEFLRDSGKFRDFISTIE